MPKNEKDGVKKMREQRQTAIPVKPLLVLFMRVKQIILSVYTAGRNKKKK